MRLFFWKKISSSFYRSNHDAERAHNDGLKINYDSPEAFEEIFWTCFNKNYKKSFLPVMDIDDETAEYYKKYINNIIASRDKKNNTRYLAKNNNNLLRIAGLKKIFPNSVIIVPFRSPVDHAGSLYNQHKKFLKIHAQDSFALKYMNWLGHFEFGKNFKALHFNDEPLLENKKELNNKNYWLRYWHSVYKYLIMHHSKQVIFFDYNKLCEQPNESLAKLEKLLKLKNGLLQNFSKKIKKSSVYKNTELNPKLISKTDKLYKQLQELAL